MLIIINILFFSSKKPLDRKFVRAVGTMGLFLRPIDCKDYNISASISVYSINSALQRIIRLRARQSELLK